MVSIAALRRLLLCCALGAVLGRLLDDDVAPLHHGAAHNARAWERAGVTPGRLCPVGSVLGEYVRRHRLQAHPPSDFGHGCGERCTLKSGNAELFLDRDVKRVLSHFHFERGKTFLLNMRVCFFEQILSWENAAAGNIHSLQMPAWPNGQGV